MKAIKNRQKFKSIISLTTNLFDKQHWITKNKQYLTKI